MKENFVSVSKHNAIKACRKLKEKLHAFILSAQNWVG